MALKGKNNEEKVWNYFKQKGLNDYACAGILGNLYAESGINPVNLQNTFEKKLGMTDEEYMKAVDNGDYLDFVTDKAGWGIYQLTYWTRKQGFLKYVQSKNKSIGDLEMQLDFLLQELTTSYKDVMKDLKNAKSVREASDAVLLKFEKPKNQGESVQQKRASYGEGYYEKYATPKATAKKKEEGTTAKPNVYNGSYRGVYRTTANLKMRKGFGLNKEVIMVLPEGTLVTATGWMAFNNSIKWLQVKYGDDTGFCSSDYLKKA